MKVYYKISKEFRQHIQFFFDNTKENELILKEVFKNYVAPYRIEVFDYCGVADCNDGYDELIDKIGKHEALEWFRVLCEFVTKEIGDFTLNDGNDLDLGGNRELIVKRDFMMYIKP